MGVGSVAISVFVSQSVCLCVCMSVCIAYLHVCPLSSQKPHVQTPQNFLFILNVAVAQSSSDNNVIDYVFPVSLNDVTFHILEPLGQYRLGHTFRPVY